eukprot:TRINITY_DN524_c0_g1_i1.p1 TRINITY_DN524_c0_g1~~TRINITY_DN524_c0_g1_i1.p1  ORF type:complete len:453 (+),score=78.30 TRINITY_DN524_c0_g1_i1:95-1453(+)
MMRKTVLKSLPILTLFLIGEFFVFSLIRRHLMTEKSDSVVNNLQQEKRILLSLETSKTVQPSTPRGELVSREVFLKDIEPDKGVWDKWHKFKSHYFVHTGKNWGELSGNRSTCLATQSTVDRLSDLVDLIEYWKGPLSLAIFVPDIEYTIVSRLLNEHLLKCYESLERIVSVHLAYPKDHPPAAGSPELEEGISSLLRNVSCSKEDSKNLIKSLLYLRPKSMLKWRETYAYPQNLLRNMARRSCQTNWTMVSDIDMLTNPDFDMTLNEFFSSPEVSKTCSKDCAYIVPTYEIKDTQSHIPNNKSALMRLVHEGGARQFHVKVFSLNQKASNLKKWESLKNGSNIKIGYKIDKYILNYEPTYISKPDAPFFDERFIGFGMTRNTQTYEMFAKGYKFYILENAFLSHWGFTQVKDRPSWRYYQQYKNRKMFSDFTKEIFARYGRDPENQTTIGP